MDRETALCERSGVEKATLKASRESQTKTPSLGKGHSEDCASSVSELGTAGNEWSEEVCGHCFSREFFFIFDVRGVTGRENGRMQKNYDDPDGTNV